MYPVRAGISDRAPEASQKCGHTSPCECVACKGLGARCSRPFTGEHYAANRSAVSINTCLVGFIVAIRFEVVAFLGLVIDLARIVVLELDIRCEQSGQVVEHSFWETE